MNPLELAAAQSCWASRPVAEKALMLLGLLLLAIALPPLPALPVILVLILVQAVRAQVPLRLYLTLVLGPATFIVLGLIPLIFSFSTSGIHLIPGGGWQAATVGGRCLVGMSATLLFALTTPVAQVIFGLRKLGLPADLTQVLVLTYRMIGSLLHTARAMWEHQAARLGHTSWRRWLSSVAAQAATLFVLSFSRARKLQSGLELRAPLGSYDTYHSEQPARRWNLAAWTAVLLVISGLSIAVSGLW